jgi:outer membrane protein assembly factor BamB
MSDDAPPDAMSAAESMAEQTAENIRRIKKIAGLVAIGIFLLCCLIGVWQLYAKVLHPYGKVAWMLDLPGGGEITPDQIYRQTADEMIFQIDTTIYAVDLTNGTQKWTLDTGEREWLDRKIDDSGFTFVGEKAVIRFAPDGSKMWGLGVGEERNMLLLENDLILYATGRGLEYDEWLQLHRPFLEESKGAFLDLEDERSMKLIKMNYKPVWENVALVALNPADGSELWRLKLPPATRIGAAESDGSSIALRIQRAKDGELQSRILVFNRADGKPTGKINLQQFYVTGPGLEGGNIVFETRKERFEHKTDGTLVGSGEPQGLEPKGYQAVHGAGGLMGRRPRAFRQDRFDDEDDEVEIADGGDGFTLYDGQLKGTGTEAWSFSMDGGLIDAASNSTLVFTNGHATKEGGEMEFIGASVDMMGLDDQLAGMVTQGVAVDDVELVALQKKDGRKVWQTHGLTGSIVCDDNRLLVLDETTLTNVTVRSTGAAGTLYFYQVNPINGKVMYKRAHQEFRLARSWLRGDQLLGFAYERGGDGKLLGLAAFKVK